MNQPQVYMYPPILNPSPTSLPTSSLWVVPEPSFECPASCIKRALVIYFTYGNIHVSMLFSQIILPLPSLTELESLFFTSCVSFAVLHIGSSLLLLLLSRFSRVRLCNPIDGSPPGSPVPGVLQARTLEWAAISFSSA